VGEDTLQAVMPAARATSARALKVLVIGVLARLRGSSAAAAPDRLAGRRLAPATRAYLNAMKYVFTYVQSQRAPQVV
jgi:hypothetical protein